MAVGDWFNNIPAPWSGGTRPVVAPGTGVMNTPAAGGGFDIQAWMAGLPDKGVRPVRMPGMEGAIPQSVGLEYLQQAANRADIPRDTNTPKVARSAAKGKIYADPKTVSRTAPNPNAPQRLGPPPPPRTFISNGNGGLGAQLASSPLPFDSKARVTLPAPASQIVTGGTPLPGTRPGITNAAASTAGTPLPGTRYAATATPAAAPAATQTGLAGKLRSGGGKIGNFARGAGGGLAAGIGSQFALNVAANATANRSPALADSMMAGSQIAPFGGMVGVPAVSAMGMSGLGATAAGTAAPILGAGLAQGFTGSTPGNEFVNRVRGATSDEEMDQMWENGQRMDYLGAAAGSLASPLWKGAAQLFTGGEETDDDLLNVVGGQSVDGGDAAAEPTPQNLMDRVFDTAKTDPQTRQQLQDLYGIMLAQGGDPKEAAQAIMQSAQEDFMARGELERSLAQSTAQQAQAQRYMKPYAESIRRQGQAESQLLQQLLPQLPAAYQAYGQYAAGNASQRANTTADAYMAQAGLAPGQAAAQQQQAYDAQLQQQIQQRQIMAQLGEMEAAGLIPAAGSGTDFSL